MSTIGSKAFKLLAASRRDWGRMDPTALWHMAEFDNPDPFLYLSELLSTPITRFDLAEIMSSAINSIAGEQWSDVSGAKVIVPLDRDHDIRQMFTNDEGSAKAENLRKVIESSARDIVAENYRERESGVEVKIAPEHRQETVREITQQGPIIVDRNPTLWAQYIHHDKDEIEAWLQSGAVLILDSGKPMLFSSKAEAEVKFGPLKELSGNLSAKPAISPAGDSTHERDTFEKDKAERIDTAPADDSPAATLPAEFHSKVIEAKQLAGELMSIRKSLEAKTGFVGMSPSDVQAAYTELARMSGPGDSPRPPKREYNSDRDDPAMSRLLSILHDLLERQGELDNVGVNVYSLIFLQDGLYEFLERHAKAASCDVLRDHRKRGMQKDGGKYGGARRIALNVLKKEAIQLSKGNIRATKDGTITIDPGLMNCPVVREVVRQLDTKASDMRLVRERLDDLGMLVTQGEHGQVQVYCLVRSEGAGGARTKMCQWFIDAHGNDGKFKIECAKD